MRPIGVRKTSSKAYLHHYGGMIYVYESRLTRFKHWWNLSAGIYCDNEKIIMLKRKLPTTEEL